jgi:hypothetical protein
MLRCPGMHNRVFQLLICGGYPGRMDVYKSAIVKDVVSTYACKINMETYQNLQVLHLSLLCMTAGR